MATIELDAGELRAALTRLKQALGRHRVDVMVSVDPRGLVLQTASVQERVPGPPRGSASAVVDGQQLVRLLKDVPRRGEVVVEVAEAFVRVGRDRVEALDVARQLALTFTKR